MMNTGEVKHVGALDYSNLRHSCAVENFQSRLAQALAASGLNQSELGRRCGIRSQTINRLLSGASRSPSSATLLKLSKALQVDVEWLQVGKGITPAPETAPVIRAVAPPAEKETAELVMLVRRLCPVQRGEVLGYAKRVAEGDKEPVKANAVL